MTLCVIFFGVSTQDWVLRRPLGKQEDKLLVAVLDDNEESASNSDRRVGFVWRPLTFLLTLTFMALCEQMVRTYTVLVFGAGTGTSGTVPSRTKRPVVHFLCLAGDCWRFWRTPQFFFRKFHLRSFLFSIEDIRNCYSFLKRVPQTTAIGPKSAGLYNITLMTRTKLLLL